MGCATLCFRIPANPRTKCLRNNGKCWKIRPMLLNLDFPGFVFSGRNLHGTQNSSVASSQQRLFLSALGELGATEGRTDAYIPEKKVSRWTAHTVQYIRPTNQRLVIDCYEEILLLRQLVQEAVVCVGLVFGTRKTPSVRRCRRRCKIWTDGLSSRFPLLHDAEAD